MSNNKIKTILFDLDGTLIDHFGAILKSYLHVYTILGFNLNNFHLTKKSLGHCTPVTLKQLVGDQHLDQAMLLYEDHYAKNLNEDLALIPGVIWLLKHLSLQNYKLAIFTNKPPRYAINHCKILQIDHFFDHIIGSNEATFKKPEKAFSEYALKQTNSSPATTILIGDSIFDIDAAHAVGMPIYSVTTGTHTKEELLSHPNQPTQIFDDLFQLGHKLFNLPSYKEILA